MALWDAGWADNQHGRGFGTSVDLSGNNLLPADPDVL
jgi:hypothetical protein